MWVCRDAAAGKPGMAWACSPRFTPRASACFEPAFFGPKEPVNFYGLDRLAVVGDEREAPVEEVT